MEPSLAIPAPSRRLQDRFANTEPSADDQLTGIWGLMLTLSAS